MENTDNLPELPDGWVWTRVGELADNIHYGYTESAMEEPVGPKFLRITDIQDNAVNWDSVPYCKIEKSEKEKYLLKDGDLVFARTGATVGKSFLIVGEIPEAVFASYLIRILLNRNLNKKYVYYFFQSLNYWAQISEGKLGIGQPNVNAQILSQLILPLPPLPEQHKIVAKIEELFTKLDAGVEALKKVKAQLKRYRQAVLKHAFEGKITEEWRDAHKDEIEPASALLERIKKERKKNAKEKYKELPPLDASDLPELPDGWVWTRVGEITQSVEKVSPNAAPDEEFTYLDIASIHGQSIVAPKKYLGKDAPSRARQLVKSGDILFSTVRTYLKHIAMIGERYDGDVASTGFCVIRPWHCIESKLLSYLLQTDTFVNSLTQIQRGTSYPAIRGSDVFTQQLPLPPLPEQHEIVEEIERRFSVTDHTEKTVERSLKQGDRLRQSILKKAFEGKLVPQDPSDEPAEKLLECIKAEKAKHETKRKEKRIIKRTIRKKKR